MNINKEKQNKVQVNYWVTPEARELIYRRANRDGIHKSAALEAIIQEWSENASSGLDGLLNESDGLERMTSKVNLIRCLTDDLLDSLKQAKHSG